MSGFRERALADYERFCRVWPGEPLGHEVFLAGIRFALDVLSKDLDGLDDAACLDCPCYRNASHLCGEHLADLQPQPGEKKL